MPSENITVGNPESHIAIATLWNKQAELAKRLDPQSYALVGQLYSKHGISIAIRNLLSNTNIQHLILCGADLSDSGSALVALWQNGVSGEHQVLGIEKTTISKDIPLEAIGELRKNVDLYDLRHIQSSKIVEDVGSFIEGLSWLSPWGEPQVYPVPEVILSSRLPSEAGAHLVSGKTVGETWLKILNEVMLFGEDAYTNYGNRARDLSNLVSVVTDEDLVNPYVADYFDFTRQGIDRYVEEFLDAKCPEGVFYTYGQRIHAFGEHLINQAEIMVKKLRKDPNDRGAVAVLYDPWHDNQLDVETPIEGFRNPCLVFIQASVKDEKLELYSTIRSNDMHDAWPRNAFGLRAFQNKLAGELERPLGTLTTLSVRAHIYEEVWPKTQEIIDGNRSKLHEFTPDPRGSFRVRVIEDGSIIMTQMDTEGMPLRPDIVWDGQRVGAAEGLCHNLSYLDTVSDVRHGMYLGRELVIAQIAARLGIPYRQNDSEGFLCQLEEAVKKADQYDKLAR